MTLLCIERMQKNDIFCLLTNCLIFQFRSGDLLLEKFPPLVLLFRLGDSFEWLTRVLQFKIKGNVAHFLKKFFSLRYTILTLIGAQSSKV